MSRDIADCVIELQDKIIDVMAESKRCLPIGDVVIIAQTYRSQADQQAAWQCGRDANGNIINKSEVKTYAKPGQSEHNRVNSMGSPASRAVDILILRYGRMVNDGKDPSYAILGGIGKKHGLEWSGDWKNSFEAAHFQLPKVVA